jgi:hypothetical protein
MGTQEISDFQQHIVRYLDVMSMGTFVECLVDQDAVIIVLCQDMLPTARPDLFDCTPYSFYHGIATSVKNSLRAIGLVLGGLPDFFSLPWKSVDRRLRST